MKRLIKYLFAVAISIAAGVPAHAVGEREVEAAFEAAADYRYAEAFALYRSAALLGNIDAQRSAGLMALYGDILYGTEIHADRAEAIHFLELAAQGGCDICVYVLAKLASPAAMRPAAVSTSCPAKSC